MTTGCGSELFLYQVAQNIRSGMITSGTKSLFLCYNLNVTTTTSTMLQRDRQADSIFIEAHTTHSLARSLKQETQKVKKNWTKNGRSPLLPSNRPCVTDLSSLTNASLIINDFGKLFLFINDRGGGGCYFILMARRRRTHKSLFYRFGKAHQSEALI